MGDDDEDWPLTDERIAQLLADVTKYPCPRSAVCLDGTERTQFAVYIVAKKALLELQQHRSAVTASKERVREVVTDLVLEGIGQGMVFRNRCANETDLDIVNAIATRAAEQLATAAPTLSTDDRVQLTSLLEYIDEQRISSVDDGRSGDFEAFTCWQASLSRLLGATK